MISSFWGLVVITCLVWYSTITIYVSIRGAMDIKRMLARLEALRHETEEEQA